MKYSISQPEGSDKPFPNWQKVLGYSFFILNLYLILRFLLTFWNRFQTISTQSKIVLAGFIIANLFVLYFSTQKYIVQFVIDYYRKEKSLYEIFLGYLFLGQIFSWFLKLVTSSVAFEIRGWFISNYIWIISSFILVRIKLVISDFPLKKNREESSGLSKKYYRRLSLGIILIASVIVGNWVFTQVYSPLPHYFHYDPEYAYMLSSTTPFKDTYLFSRMDHPGSIMQLFGSLFNVILSPLTFGQAGYPTFINTINPQYFIYLARFFILTISITAIVLLARKTIRITSGQDVFAALSIPLIYFSSHSVALEFTAIWSPNSFNFAFGSVILFCLLMILHFDEASDKNLIWVSVAAGFIATFHVFLITWSIGIGLSIFLYLWFTRNNINLAIKQAGISLLNYIKGYLIGFFVIINQFESFVDWISQVTLHREAYGGGAEGYISGEQIINSFQQIIQNSLAILTFTIVLILFFIFLLLFLRKKITDAPGLWAIAIGLIVQIAALSVMVLKNPRDRYMLSIASILPILLAALLLICQPYKKITKFLYPTILILLISTFSISFTKNINLHQDRTQYIDAYQKDVDNFLSDYAATQNLDQTELKKYWSYGTFSECYSLWFGNEYAKNLFNDEIGEYCDPNNEYSISIWSKKIIPFRNQKINNLGQDSVIIGESSRLVQMGLTDFIEYKSAEILNLSYFTPISKEP